MSIGDLPTLNATLNGVAAILLGWGRWAIHRGHRSLHKKLMMGALISSALFLTSYLIYHFHHVVTRYPGYGWDRWLYFLILATHIPLAILMLPFIFIAVRHAFRGDFQKHVQVTKRVWPVWMYVSVTGVIIYLMLYRPF